MHETALTDIDRRKAEFRGLPDRLAREDMLLVPFGGMGRDRIGGDRDLCVPIRPHVPRLFLCLDGHR